MTEEIFGFDDKTSEGNDFNFITVTKETAIQEPIYLEDLKLGKWEGKENAYLEVVVRNEAGQTANKRYNLPMKVDGKFTKFDGTEGTDEDLKKAGEKFQKLAKNIATKILGEDTTISGKGVEDFCNNLITKIKSNPKWNKTALRVLFIHNSDGFTTLRAFAPMCELSSLPKAQSRLIPGDYDNYVVKKTPSTESDDLGTGQPVDTTNLF
jgi:hypothetical protein